MDEDVRLAAEVVEAWVGDLLGGAGLEAEAAATVADTLVDASLRGVDSHGVARVPNYVERLRGGGLNPRPRPRFEREHGGIALMHGDDGPGQVAGVLATDHSVALAREHGVGVVGVRRSAATAPPATTPCAPRGGADRHPTTNSRSARHPLRRPRSRPRHQPARSRRRCRDGVFGLDMATSQVASTASSTPATPGGRSRRAGASTRRAGGPPTPPP